MDTAESSSDSNDDRTVHSLRIGNINNCAPNVKSILTVAENTGNKRIPTITKITLHDTPVEIQIDSGSDVKIISERTYARLKNKPNLHSTNIKLYPFASRHPLPLLGKLTAVIETAKIFEPAVFYVVKNTKQHVRNIFGAITSTKFGFLKIETQLEPVPEVVTAQNSCHLNNLYYKEKDENNKSEKIAELVERYYDIFSGMGEMKVLL